MRHSIEHTSTRPVWHLLMPQSNQSSGCRIPDPCSQPTQGTHHTYTTAAMRGDQPRAPPSITRHTQGHSQYLHPVVPVPALLASPATAQP